MNNSFDAKKNFKNLGFGLILMLIDYSIGNIPVTVIAGLVLIFLACKSFADNYNNKDIYKSFALLCVTPVLAVIYKVLAAGSIAGLTTRLSTYVSTITDYDDPQVLNNLATFITDALKSISIPAYIVSGLTFITPILAVFGVHNIVVLMARDLKEESAQEIVDVSKKRFMPEIVTQALCVVIVGLAVAMLNSLLQVLTTPDVEMDTILASGLMVYVALMVIVGIVLCVFAIMAFVFIIKLIVRCFKSEVKVQEENKEQAEDEDFQEEYK